jgi:hypothetical protein
VRAPATSFPLYKYTGGGDTAPAFSGLCVVYSAHGKWVFPPSCGVFLPPLILQAFPFLIAGHVLLLLQAGMFVYSSCGRSVCPPLLWSFPPSTTLTSFPTPGCWAFLPSPARPSLFIYSSGRDSPPPDFSAQGAPPSLLRVFIVLIAYYSVSLFSPGWGLVCPGGYADLAQGCLWKYCVPHTSPCPHLPKPSGCGHLEARGPSWFLHLT